MRSLFTFILAVSVSFSGFTQPQLDTLTKRFDRFRLQDLNEKVFLDIDRNFHLTGELLWFKVYAVDGSFHKPLNISKVAYIEILDKDNTPLLQTKISLDNGMGSGSLFIPASLSSGNYWIRAYTNWMKNKGANFFAYEIVSIVNPFVKPDAVKAETERSVRVDFFPEGGNLVDGLPGVVGFRILNENTNETVRGFIITAQRDTVARFQGSDGMPGRFEFTPSLKTSYTAVLKTSSGKVTTHSFPAIFNQGYTLRVTDTGDHINVLVNTKFENLKPRLIYLFIHCRQIMIQAEASYTRPDTGLNFSIPKNKLPDGISHFTIFDEELRPVCERLYFRHPENLMTVAVNSQQNYGQRSKVKLELHTSLHEKKVPAHLSIAVFKNDSLSQLPEPGIFERLWLTSDLKTFIASAEPFLGKDSLSIMAMDNLMLTEGWRRFSWNDILNQNIVHQYAPEFRSHVIRGQVLQADNTPARGVMAFLAAPGKIIRTYCSRSNASGEIQFETKEIFGSQQLIVQAHRDADSAFNVTIHNPFSASTANHALPVLTLKPKIHDKLLERSISMQVQDIFDRSQRQQFNTAEVDSLPFYGQPDERYLLDDYTRFPVMEEVMREYVPGVMIRVRKDGFQFMVIDQLNKGIVAGNPLMLLDGVPIFDPDEIMAFDPRKVKRLDVMTRRYYLGPFSFGGLVSYSTYTGDLAGFKLNPRSISLNYEGLQLAREFFQPDYESKTKRSERFPDQRQLLYRNPSIATDSNGHAVVEFYTSDVSGNYQVNIEALTDDGKAASGRCTFSVNRFDN